MQNDYWIKIAGSYISIMKVVEMATANTYQDWNIHVF